MKIGFISLGCPKNQVDTEIMMGELSGYELTNRLEEAEIVVINTCGFITPAKEEAIEAILDSARQKAEGNLRYLAVTGCLAQRYARELLTEMPEIDGLMGIGNPRQVSELIRRMAQGERPCLISRPPETFREEGPRVLASNPGWAYLKIAEGCNNRCAYCAIPGIRGNLRSRSRDSILQEARRLVDQGTRELVLIAQDTTVYGSDLGDYGLSELLAELDRLPGLDWLRVLYAHPAHLQRPVMEAMASLPRVVPYLDLPVQHCNDRILKRMGRGHTRGQLEELLDSLRENIPGLVLRTTVMTGFPGEGEAEFQELKEFVIRQRFNWLGAFAYSPEEGTLSSQWADDVEPAVKQRRVHDLQTLQQTITRDWLQSLVGTVDQVLVEGPWKNGVWGRTRSQAPEVDGKVCITEAAGIPAGKMVKVRIKRVKGIDLIGEMLREPA